ncbi:probable E3 SUMO-protein ligase RNF212 isoform X3 [Panulirus ornatus]|uniref:probable E3 SUMO-protein ligase RNF212 isoform X3 n=1 Tax=Panulirus ornatus TaxID=150431 RepID=UPI003A872FDC
MSRKRQLESPTITETCYCTRWVLPMRQQHPFPCRFYLRKLELLYYFQEINDINMDWINCNSCCRQPGDESERTFALTSCGHIFCDLCLAQAESRFKCSACSSQCQLIQLSSKMKPDAEMYFLEPAALLKRHYTQINRLLEFQKDHRIRLVSFHRKVLQKYKVLEKQHSATTSHMQELERRYTTATKRIQELEIENQNLRSMMSCQGGIGGIGSSSLEPYPRLPVQKKNSPKQVNGLQVSPGGARISPGRLSLVRTSQESAVNRHSPTNMPATTLPHTIAYGAIQGARTPVSQYSSPPPPYLHANQQPQVLHVNDNSHTPTRPGVGCYRTANPSPSRTPSPMRCWSVKAGRN